MASLTPSLELARHLPGKRVLCSWKAGWRSLLLRGYREPRVADAFTIPATNDQTFVLVTNGGCDLEARSRGRWRRTQYRPGSLALTSPGEPTTLRWNGPIAHATLQLHLPETTVRTAILELTGREPSMCPFPNLLHGEDALIGGVLRGLAVALVDGAPDLYAETAGDLLAAHLVCRYIEARAPREQRRHDRRLNRVEALMRERIRDNVSLQELADEAGVSRHHLLRLFRQAYGETPLRRLTRIRMDEARILLARSRHSIALIAGRCGYSNPTHFATAFRRIIGVAPRDYRRGTR